jgi:hypothetical protein
MKRSHRYRASRTRLAGAKLVARCNRTGNEPQIHLAGLYAMQVHSMLRKLMLLVTA